MEKFLQQMRELLASLSGKQKIFIGGGGGAALLGVIAFVTVLAKPEYKILYSGLAQEEAQSIARHLAEKNVSYELTPDGTALKVAPDQIDKARLDLAAQGLPRSGRLGFEIFDKPNWAGSDFAEKVNYQRALEGELERTIQTIASVEAVRVHLVMPRESLFTEREREAKAAVVIKLRNARIEEDSVKAITFLVASSVDTLKPENVTVVGADGRSLTSPTGHGTSLTDGKLEETLAKKLILTLAPVIGADRLRASVNVEFDSASSESTQESYDPQKSVLLTTHVSEDRQGGGVITGGVPGTASNVPQAAPVGAVPLTKTTEEGQFQKTQSETYAVSKLVKHSLQPAGDLKRIATAVLIDDAENRRKRTPEEMKQFEELAKAAIGFDTARGDTIVVENISFQTTPVEPIKAPDWKDKVDTMANRWQTPLRYFGLLALALVAYLLIVRPLLRPVGRTVANAPAPVSMPVLPGAEPAVALAGGGSTQITDDAMFLESELAQELSATSSDIKRAVILKRHLVEKVKQEPAVASRLIQNWIHSKGDRR
jgi:flagellar M-ring protein FliF